MASQSISYEVGNKYSVFDIFINHRGPDVKEGLATHLYRCLTECGLKVFLDREELQVGENFPPQIEGAIKTASLHIAIFSPGYAESTWCLRELVLMLESKKTILPVFYKVDPSKLRWTLAGDGEYTRALQNLEMKRTFDSQEPRYDSNTIEKWRNSLRVVSDINGFDLKAYNGDEGQLVKKIVEQVCKKVGKTPLNVAKHPTGLDEKVEDLERTVLSQQQSEKARVVGIVGIGGLGKTTLAKYFFNSQISNYDRSCFVHDVRENTARNSLTSLQNLILKNLAHSNVQITNTDQGIEELKKYMSSSHSALLVLDDVDHIDQLDALFSPVRDRIHPNSLILITSRNKDILTNSGIVESSLYKQTALNRPHSRQLLCSHAFNQPYPVIGFERLVENCLDVCYGLPLSLKVIGALLCGKDLEYWEAQMQKVSKTLPNDIMSRLKISYDSLDEEEKQIFLDIACFFIGQDRDTAIRIWDGSCWQGWLGLRNLENRCLVEVDSQNCIKMHDHLRDMGRDIAKKETPHRLWRSDDILSDQSYEVRGISMVHRNGPEQCFEIPTNMRGLQLLEAEGDSVERIVRVAQPPQPAWLCCYSRPSVERIVHVAQPPQLVWLSWHSCPFRSLPSWISLKNLRVLHIDGEKLKTLWQHESQAPLQLRELLIHAQHFSVPKSIVMLKQLDKFVLRSNKYGHLDDEVGGMHNLKHFELYGCTNIKLLPHSVGNWNKLQYISLSGCFALQGLPDSAGSWTSLQSIYLRRCSALHGLPDSAGSWTSLQSIDLGGCSTLQGLPDFGRELDQPPKHRPGRLLRPPGAPRFGRELEQPPKHQPGRLLGPPGAPRFGRELEQPPKHQPDLLLRPPVAPRFGRELDQPPTHQPGRLLHPPGAPRVGRELDQPSTHRPAQVLSPPGAPRFGRKLDQPPKHLPGRVLRPPGAPRFGRELDQPPKHRPGRVLRPPVAPRFGRELDQFKTDELARVLLLAVAPRFGRELDQPPKHRPGRVLRPPGAPSFRRELDQPPTHQPGRLLHPPGAPRVGRELDQPSTHRPAQVLCPPGAPRFGRELDQPPKHLPGRVLRPPGAPRFGRELDQPPKHRPGRVLRPPVAPRFGRELDQSKTDELARMLRPAVT